MDDPAARFATADEIAARFGDRSPTRLWIRPLVMQRSEQGEQKVIGEPMAAYLSAVTGASTRVVSRRLRSWRTIPACSHSAFYAMILSGASAN